MGERKGPCESSHREQPAAMWVKKTNREHIILIALLTYRPELLSPSANIDSSFLSKMYVYICKEYEYC